MSHNLFGERFFGRREPAWHKLGTVVDGDLSATEAARVVGLEKITFELRPLLVDLGKVSVPFDKLAIVRNPTDDDPDYRVVGEASKGYALMQNDQIAKAIDPLTNDWPTETAGALSFGETVFFTLDAGMSQIKEEEIRQFFLITDCRDGATAMNIAFTPVRVVCQNTLLAGKMAAIASADLRHTSSIEHELKWRVDMIKRMQDVQGKVMTSFEAMAQVAIEDDEAKHLIAIAYAYPRKPRKVELLETLDEEESQRLGSLLATAQDAQRSYETAMLRMDERRAAAFDLFSSFGEKTPQTAGTIWAAYNSIVEVEDWRERQGVENPDDSLLFGERAKTKQKAFAAAVDLATGKTTGLK